MDIKIGSIDEYIEWRSVLNNLCKEADFANAEKAEKVESIVTALMLFVDKELYWIDIGIKEVWKDRHELEKQKAKTL